MKNFQFLSLNINTINCTLIIVCWKSQIIHIIRHSV